MPGRKVFVDVTIKSISPLDFEVMPRANANKPPLPTKGSGKPGQPIIEFHNDHHAGFEIYFELQGDTKGYFFPPDPKDAVWSKLGSVCPKKAVWDVLEPKQVLGSGPALERRTLVAYNANPEGPPGQGPFQYNLRVTDGTDWQDLDPGGDNTNGSYRSDVSSFVAYGALAVGAAVAIVAITETLHVTNLFR